MTVGCGNAETSGTIQASVVKSSIKPWSFSIGTKENRDCQLKLSIVFGTLPESSSRELAQDHPVVVFKTVVMCGFVFQV